MSHDDSTSTKKRTSVHRTASTQHSVSGTQPLNNGAKERNALICDFIDRCFGSLKYLRHDAVQPIVAAVVHERERELGNEVGLPWRRFR